MDTGKLIKELRIKKGLTQEELAERTEVSVRTIQRIENGDVDPRAYTLQMIAKALEVDFSLFVEKEDKEIQEADNTGWSGFLHLSGILPLFFPTWIIWKNIKNKQKEMTSHYLAAMSMQLAIVGISIVGLWIYFKVNQLTPFYGGLLAGALISIFNAINVMNGKKFINPFVKDQ